MVVVKDPSQGKVDANLLHHLSFPRWGNRRIPRRAGADHNGEDRNPVAAPSGNRKSPSRHDGDRGKDGGLEELRKKLMGHLWEAADRMKLSAQEVARPWNLRARWQANKNRHRGYGSPRATAAGPTMGTTVEEEEEKRKSALTISLMAKEIEEDIYVVTRSRSRRRPKKRSQVVQLLT